MQPGNGSRATPTKVFFASDLHGSERGFRKFVAAAAFYGADVLVYGGDLMGKGLVPIVRTGDRYTAGLRGESRELEGREELDGFRSDLGTAGLYSVVVDPDEYRELRDDPAARQDVFDRLARERVASWVALAEERLAGTPVRCFLTGGNDDTPEVLTLLDGLDTEHVVGSEHRVVDLDAEHTMITVGYSTPTPWGTPRERSEEDIAAAIRASADRVPDLARCVFNLHAPPIGSPLDRCVKVEPGAGAGPDDLPRPVMRHGHPVYTTGGSRAVRDAITTYQPAVGLHGHIHESPGRIRLGRTQCFNPGSEYAQGTLQGMIVALRGGRVVGYQHTVG